MDFKKAGRIWKKIWQFIWDDDSVWSWVVNIVLAFVLIKFIVYPVLMLLLGTNFPIVAVVSGSMEHDTGFDEWWSSNEEHYIDQYGITRSDFEGYRFRNGFNKGDIMILYGSDHSKIEVGDVIVFRGGRSDPIIHRVVTKEEVINRSVYFTKGDHNPRQIQDDRNIPEENVLGEAIIRVPFLGWIKIVFVDMLNLFR